MLERFEGPQGKQRLLNTVARQGLINGDVDLARKFADRGVPTEFKTGELLITKDATDTDVYLLLTGRVGIEINGAQVGTREKDTHVGEMAAIDPAAPRSANVRAQETTVALKLSDDAFNELATAHPQIWRRLAIEIADRLRQRTKFFRTRNDRPQLFIGSSSEMLPVAQAIQGGFSHENITVTVWSDGAFRASRDAITNLLAIAERADFAVLVLGPDDVVISRGAEQAAARDNVIFELGLFLGAVGRDRTFIVKPRGVDVRVPSDLLGMAPIEFDPDEGTPIGSRIGAVCTELRGYISTSGVR